MAITGHPAGSVAAALATPFREGALTRRPSTRRLQLAVAIAIVPMVAVVVWLVSTSDHIEYPTARALHRSYQIAVPMLVGLLWWRRRPASRFGPLLILFGILAWISSWQSSDWPLAYDLGVIAEGPVVILTFYLFLSFPSGRLTSTVDRVIIAGWVLALLVLFIAFVLVSPVISGGGALTSCVPACPDNVLQIASAPGLAEVFAQSRTSLLLFLIVAVLVVYAVRLRRASRPRRRALIAVAATSLLFLPVFFMYHFANLVLELDPDTLKGLSWYVVGARVLLPLGFLVALLQADLYAGTVRKDLLEELVRRPSPERWRDAVARAFDDPQLQIAYWDPESARYRQADGSELARPDGPDRAWAEVDRNGRPVAAMVVDAALVEDPELVAVATTTTRLAIENGDLEGELRDSRARILAAGDEERRRIERDLHDSAQQRLVALRIHLALAGESMEGSEQRVIVERLGTEVDEALEDLRSVASGVYPAVLREFGTGAALRSCSRQAAIPVSVDDRWQRRHSEATEHAVYFCCLEALQNAAKHAGPTASATVRLIEDDGLVRFAVEDDGVGFDPGTVARGAGLANISDRVSAAGGTARIESVPGAGTRVSGELPA